MAAEQTSAPVGHTAEMPSGMVRVSKDEFYNIMGPRNVGPSPNRYSTDWIDLSTQRVVGWSSRGYCGPFEYQGAPPKVYAVASEYAKATGAQS